MRKILGLLAVCLLVTGCLNRNKQKTIKGLLSEDKLPTEMELGGYPITDREFERKEFYVTDRQGVDARQEPDEGSDSLIHYDYGQFLKIIIDPGQMYEALYYNPALYYRTSSGVSPDFYAVAGDVYREWRDDERDCTVQSWRYEIVFVKRNALGDMSEVRLIPGELNEVFETEAKFGNDVPTAGELLSVELINRCVYDSMEMHKAGNFRDESAPKIDEKITALKTETGGEVVFEDCTEAGDVFRYYRYEGVYEALNKYLVSIKHFDYLSYCFVDKITGEITEFDGFPYVTPDMKRILCIYPIDGVSAGVTLYKITDDRKIVFIMESQYINWGVADYRNRAFWGSDGAFYCEARHSAVNWGSNPTCQYLRIKLSGV